MWLHLPSVRRPHSIICHLSAPATLLAEMPRDPKAFVHQLAAPAAEPDHRTPASWADRVHRVRRAGGRISRIDIVAKPAGPERAAEYGPAMVPVHHGERELREESWAIVGDRESVDSRRQTFLWLHAYMRACKHTICVHMYAPLCGTVGQ